LFEKERGSTHQSQERWGEKRGREGTLLLLFYSIAGRGLEKKEKGRMFIQNHGSPKRRKEGTRVLRWRSLEGGGLCCPSKAVVERGGSRERKKKKGCTPLLSRF